MACESTAGSPFWVVCRYDWADPHGAPADGGGEQLGWVWRGGSVRITPAGHLGASMVTVHASGGADVLAAAVRAASPFPELQVLALTVITSLDDGDLASIGIGGSLGAQVERLAHLARDAGCDGVVCSVHEAAVMRSMWGPEALVVTPGIGLGAGHEMRGGGDQVRMGTPEDAGNAGASHVVLGRSITGAPDPRAAYGAARLRFLG